MSSETILHSDLSHPIIIPDCAVTNEGDSPSINESAQIDMTGTTVNAEPTVECAPGKRSEDALLTNQNVPHDEAQKENGGSKISTNDSESMTGSKDNTETSLEVNKKNEKPDDKCNTIASDEVRKKLEFSNNRIAKQFRVFSSNKAHKSGKVNKIFFGTVENPVPGKEEVWRILYDDGDVDIMSRAALLDAMSYYDLNKKYDTNHVHNNSISSMPQRSEEYGEKGGRNATAKSKATSGKAKIKRKATPPSKAKKIGAKVPKKEVVPEWTGPPDDKVDGGWPKGWVKKVFVRNNGATKGTKDRYWYSPNEKYKLRSMVQVKKFLKALAENKGDEKKAKAAIGRL